jgi:hypothetical protein
VRLVALALLATGCASVPAAKAEETPVRGAGSCDAKKAQGLVGKTRSEAVGAKARRLSGAARLRWIPKDSMVTMDYREDRLNLHLDARNRIVRIACG